MSSLRRFGSALCVLAASTASLFAPTASVATTPAPPCPSSSWVAGTVDLCGGSLVYNDYLHDDYGADTGGILTGSRTSSLAPSAGDEAYPDGQEATADLVRLTLRIDGNRLHVSALLNALYTKTSTILAVAIDADHDPSTGGGKWGPLNVSSEGWDRIAFFPAGDPRTNTIAGTMPLPSGRRWRVQAATAEATSKHVMNVGFRGLTERARFTGQLWQDVKSDLGSWFEDNQSAALADGDVSAFGYVVDVADLRNGVTRVQPVGPGLHERVYTSQYTVPPGEGHSIEGVPGRGDGGGQLSLGFEQFFQYLGAYQAYGIYIPDKRGPHGMQMVFHGSNANLSSLINQPGMQQRFGEDLNRILVVPEARGPDGYGTDISERDLLDVMADVQAHYPIDRRKVFTGGYSQGGYIAFRMAELYPDRFAGAITWVGFTGDAVNGTPLRGTFTYTAGGVGNVIDYVGNLRHVPTIMLFSAGDYLVHVSTALGMDQAFKAAEGPYIWYLHPAAEHLTFAILDDWRKEAADSSKLTLVEKPSRVTYSVDPWLDDPAHGIVHDRAYWVSEIRGRADDVRDVDLVSSGCGGSVPEQQAGTGAGVDPVPWVSDVRWFSGHVEPIPAAPALGGSLRNVASLSIDADAICSRDRAISYSITTDGPTTVRFGAGRTLTLKAAGTFNGVLAPRAVAPKVLGTKTGAKELPATGADVHVLAASLLLAVAIASRRIMRIRSRRPFVG